MAGVRGRKPNVATDVIVQAILDSESGVVTTADFGGKVTAKRLLDLTNGGPLVLRKATQPIIDPETGKAGRGRPRKQFGLTPSARKRAKRLAAKASA